MGKMSKNDKLFVRNTNFYTLPQKINKATSNFYQTRKILRKMFWSQGTHSGVHGVPNSEVFRSFSLVIKLKLRVFMRKSTSINNDICLGMDLFIMYPHSWSCVTNFS